MAMISCTDCHREISDQAASCPHCGCPSLNKTRVISQRDNEPNPVREPLADPDRENPNVRSAISRGMVRKFREQMHALGALWMIMGAVAVAAAGFALQGSAFLANSLGATAQVLLFIIALLGVLWFSLGMLTCLKQMWAVYVGLVLSYLSLVGQIVNLNVCSGIILIVVILQAHRVIGWANKMHAAGVPLTTKPE